jgi:hypothetical protein
MGGVERRESRVDKLLVAGRITEDEAVRVRAGDGDDADAAVAEIRLRHVRDWLDAAVVDGRMSRAEADGIVERVERGEDPRSLLRAQAQRERG